MYTGGGANVHWGGGLMYTGARDNAHFTPESKIVCRDLPLVLWKLVDRNNLSAV